MTKLLVGVADAGLGRRLERSTVSTIVEQVASPVKSRGANDKLGGPASGGEET
jgi:hypothetical protein